MIFKVTAVQLPGGVQFAKGLPLDEHGASYVSPNKGLFPKGHRSPAGEVITPTSKLIRDTNRSKVSGYQINLDAVNKLREKIKAGITGVQIESELRREIARLKLELETQHKNGVSARETHEQGLLRLQSCEEELRSLTLEYSQLMVKSSQSEKAERDKMTLQSSYDKLTDAYKELARERDTLNSRLEASAPSLSKEIEGEVERSRLELANERIDQLSASLRGVETDNLRLKREVEEAKAQLLVEVRKSGELESENKVMLEALEEDRKNLTQRNDILQEKSNRDAAELETSHQAVNAMSSLLKTLVGDADLLGLFAIKPSEEVVELILNGASASTKNSLERHTGGTTDSVQSRDNRRRRGGLGNTTHSVRLSDSPSVKK